MCVPTSLPLLAAPQRGQAAVRSVQLAAPFNPFPKELRNRDEIHIIRTWQYQSNNVLTTN